MIIENNLRVFNLTHTEALSLTDVYNLIKGNGVRIELKTIPNKVQTNGKIEMVKTDQEFLHLIFTEDFPLSHAKFESDYGNQQGQYLEFKLKGDGWYDHFKKMALNDRLKNLTVRVFNDCDPEFRRHTKMLAILIEYHEIRISKFSTAG